MCIGQFVDVLKAPRSAMLCDVLSVLAERNIAAMPVVDEAGKVIGASCVQCTYSVRTLCVQCAYSVRILCVYCVCAALVSCQLPAVSVIFCVCVCCPLSVCFRLL